MTRMSTTTRGAAVAIAVALAAAGAADAAQGEWILRIEPMFMDAYGHDQHVLTIHEIDRDAAPAVENETPVHLDTESGPAYHAEFRYRWTKWSLGTDFFWFNTSQGRESRSAAADAAVDEVIFAVADRRFTSSVPGEVVYFGVLEDTDLIAWTADFYAMRTLAATPESGIHLRFGLRVADFDNDYRAIVGVRDIGGSQLDAESNYGLMLGPLVGLTGDVRRGKNRVEGHLAQSVVLGTAELAGITSDFTGWFMKPLVNSRGPFRAEHLRSGDPYELSNGHAIYCSPTGGRGSKAEGAGYLVIRTDPASEDVGIDTGFSPEPSTLRAPDLASGRIPDEPGWVKGVPRLAVEYVDTGQDEDDLATKIADLLAAGTELIWVVRLQGPRRVEVYRPGERMRIVNPGETLEAPGILDNAVAVEALYDADAASDVALRNLLQRKGYVSLEAVQGKGKAEGKAEGELLALRESLVTVLEARKVGLDDEQRAAIAACADTGVLRRWLVAAGTASAAEDVFS